MAQLDREARAFPLEKWDRLIALAIFCLGAALRIFLLDSLPAGLNQDEASVGYDAWSLLTHGVDRNGYALPLVLKSWGGGQSALYAYLSMPFIALLGPGAFSVRLVALLAGIATLPVFWLLAREARGRAFALTALLVLAVNPWHIMISRWALDANLLPFFLMLGIYLMVLSRRRPLALVFSALAFALALYTFASAFFFLPPFLIFGVVWLRRRGALRASFFIPALALFILVAAPITTVHINSLFGSRDLTLFGFSLPKLAENERAAAVFFGGGMGQAAEYYSRFLSLLVRQSDALPFNSIPFYGIFYYFGLPFAAAGLISCVANFRDRRNEIPMLAALLCSLLCAFFIAPDIKRMNMAWLPIIYFEAVGLHMLMRRMKRFFAVPVMCMLVCAALFVNAYYRDFQHSEYYYPGLREAIEYVEAEHPESVFVTSYVNQPYIFELFYNNISPHTFQESVNYVNRRDVFESVSGFGKYSFGRPEDARAQYLILHNHECGDAAVLATFGSYSVCMG